MFDKNSDGPASFLVVVAGALKRTDGHCLMHKRPFGKPHGGLWEFPGGKVEAGEMPVAALVRELHEELGITVDEADCTPVAFAEDGSRGAGRSIVLLLYIVRAWGGAPVALEGGEVSWFAPSEVAMLDTPPLDCVLAKQLFGAAQGR